VQRKILTEKTGTEGREPRNGSTARFPDPDYRPLIHVLRCELARYIVI